jgi:hypothetical protein
MRDVNDARDPEDERKSGRDKEQTGCRSKAVKRLKGEALPVHRSSGRHKRGGFIWITVALATI